MRFDLAETIGGKDHSRTQYLQICAMGDDAQRIVRAGVRKGSLIWVSGSLELELFTKKDGITTDKRLKVLLDNWGFVPIGANRAAQTAQTGSPDAAVPSVVDGERDHLPE